MLKQKIAEYKAKLEKAMCEYMEMPPSERASSALNALIETYHKLGDMEEAPAAETGFTKENARMWNQWMKNSDGSMGGHWTIDQTNGLAGSMGVYFDHITADDWNVVCNMMWSDYGAVASAYGVATPEFFGELAKAFLFDKDGPAPKEKLAAYYHGIVCAGKKY